MAKQVRITEILAAVAALACIALGYLSRQALNPDGVAYLDLAAAVQRGDWTHFVQGYWSPLFPLVVGALGQLTGQTGSGLVPLTHAINAVAAVGAVALLWHWNRRRSSGDHAHTALAFGVTVLSAYLLCSAGLPRIEAVTPDILLLTLAAWLGYELLVNGGRRWLLVGVLLGCAFLTKTSAWPWLVVAVPVRLWAARDVASRRAVVLSSLSCAVIALTWVVPMTLKYRHPTLGSAAALNYSWYINASTSRLPDTDRGTHSAYHNVGVGNGRLLTVATFDDAAYWTYQPWDDPTDWAMKALTNTDRTPTAGELMSYWVRMTARVFVLWMGPLIALTIIPWLLLQKRPGMMRELLSDERDALAVMLLGMIGLLQFAAIHGEPRLIAPFGLILALGAADWSFNKPASRDGPLTGKLRVACLTAGVVAVAAFAYVRFSDGVSAAERLVGVTGQLDELRDRIGSPGGGPVPIAVVGPAAPVMATAYWANAHIAMQLAPAFAALVATLPKDQQDQMLQGLFRGKVAMIWRTSDDGSTEMLQIPPS